MLRYAFSRHRGIEIVTHPFSKERKEKPVDMLDTRLETFSFGFCGRISLLLISFFHYLSIFR